MTIHSKRKTPSKKTQPVLIDDDSDNVPHTDQAPRAGPSRGTTSGHKAIALESDSESDEEANHLLGLLAPRAAPRLTPTIAPTPPAPTPVPTAQVPRGRAPRAIPGEPKPFPGFGKRVAVDNHFLLSIIHYSPFPLSEQDNLDGTMAEKWDNCLSTVQEEDSKSFGALTPQLCYTSWLAFRDEYETRMLSGDYWGEQSDEEREVPLSRRASGLKSERLHLLQNCYMLEVEAICKRSPSIHQELAKMTPERKKVFCYHAHIPLPGQRTNGKGCRRGNAFPTPGYGRRYAPY